MNIISAIASLIGTLFRSLFCKSEAERAGFSEAKVEILSKEVEILKAQASASASSPKAKRELLDILKSGKAVILLALLLTACNTTAGYTCLTLQDWSSIKQDELAANLSTIPENSPIMFMALDWARMRAETKACISNIR